MDGSSVGTVGTYTFSNVTANHTISATFKADTVKYSLTINKLGSGTGTVKNSPSGLSFTKGTVVNLTATPDAGSSFKGWSGGCSGITSTCKITMNANVNVTAKFALERHKSNITITSPSGGETLSSGSTWTVTWESSSDVAKYDLSYYDGFNWKPIAKDVTGSRYQWHIPAVTKNKKDCKVRVVGYDAQGKKIASDNSIGTFAVKVVKLTSLNGGQKLIAGSSQTIQWTTYSVIRDVAKTKLFYTLNGGRKWKKIEGLTENAGRYTWTIPAIDETRSECKVKVVLEAPGGAIIGSDESDSFFSIKPAS